ncbi:MAG: hypothetical protein ACXWV2_10935 [Chitinophagaceae bacterium]
MYWSANRLETFMVVLMNRKSRKISSMLIKTVKKADTAHTSSSKDFGMRLETGKFIMF